jgi:DNA-binding winged helix-turn-helix (wHTH) protein/Tfp pilus assembly protein PilF
VDQPADIHFDDWTFRAQPRELLRQGRRVRLQDQPLQVLEELLMRPGELVTREHLIGRLWPKRVVEFDAALNAAVRRLRAALGDEAETPRYIETVPRQGYRFIGALQPMEVELGSGAAVERPVAAANQSHGQHDGRGTHRWRAVLLAGVLVIAAGLAALWLWNTPEPAASDGAAAQAAEPLVRARFFAQRRAPGDLERARQQYELALSADPNVARAWSGLASVYWLESAEGLQPREVNLPKIRDAAQRALELDPRLAEAHLRLALYLVATGDRAEAKAHYRNAAALEPNDPLVLSFLAGDAADNNRWDEAIILQRRAAAAEPLSPIAAANLAHYLFLAGRVEEAKSQFAKVLELDPTFPDEILVFVDILEGRHEEALRKAETWRDGMLRDQVLAMAYYGLGRRAESDAQLGALIARTGWRDTIAVAEVYAFRGETEEAFRWLQAPDTLTPDKPQRLLYASPFLKSLHADERWTRIVEVR